MGELNTLNFSLVIQDEFYIYGKYEHKRFLAWGIHSISIEDVNDSEIPEDYEDWAGELGNKIFEKYNPEYFVIVFKGKNYEPYRLIDLPKIKDVEILGGSSTNIGDKIYSEKGLFLYLQEMKTISYKDLNKDKVDDINLKYVD
jgi:hypothetical protein